MDGSGGRKENVLCSALAKLGLDAEIGGYLDQFLALVLEFCLRCFWSPPPPVVRSRSPPVLVGICLLPKQPHFARWLGEKIFTRIAHGDGESFRAFAHKHHMSGVAHDIARYETHVLNVANASDRARFARRTMHAAGIKLDDSFLVGQSAKPDTLIVGIVFLALANVENSLKGILPILQHIPSFGDCLFAGVFTDNDRLLGPGEFFDLLPLHCRSLVPSSGLSRNIRSGRQGCSRNSSVRKELPAGKLHAWSSC